MMMNEIVVQDEGVEMTCLHVDPLTVDCSFIIDSTGHPAEIVRVIENTKEIFPNVYVADMCANASFGSCRIGPIFGGMLLSGRKAAKIIADRLRKEKEARQQQQP